eukprot:20797-Pleurochrysis_carterae.AAC.1
MCSSAAGVRAHAGVFSRARPRSPRRVSVRGVLCACVKRPARAGVSLPRVTTIAAMCVRPRVCAPAPRSCFDSARRCASPSARVSSLAAFNSAAALSALSAEVRRLAPAVHECLQLHAARVRHVGRYIELVIQKRSLVHLGHVGCPAPALLD